MPRPRPPAVKGGADVRSKMCDFLVTLLQELGEERLTPEAAAACVSAAQKCAQFGWHETAAKARCVGRGGHSRQRLVGDRVQPSGCCAHPCRSMQGIRSGLHGRERGRSECGPVCALDRWLTAEAPLRSSQPRRPFRFQILHPIHPNQGVCAQRGDPAARVAGGGAAAARLPALCARPPGQGPRDQVGRPLGCCDRFSLTSPRAAVRKGAGARAC